MANYKTGKMPKELKAMTEEEKKNQMMRFIAQKRESFAQGVLFNLCQGLNFVPNEDAVKDLVDRSIEMADYLMERLYTIKEEKDEASGEQPTD